jgi:hypothetical protein
MQISNAIKSFLFGSPGNYSLGFIDIEFKNSDTYYSFSRHGNFIISGLGSAMQTLIRSRTFKILTFSYTQLFVHEFGHAIAHKITNRNGRCTISVYSNQGQGNSHFYDPTAHKVARTFVGLGGPLLSIIFSISKIAVVNMFSASLPTVVVAGVTIGSVIWITGELIYASTPFFGGQVGDFADIANQGSGYLMTATAILLSTTILGLKLAYKIG